MTVYMPRQKTNGKWFYTCSNGSGIFDVGYCKTWEGCPKCRADIYNDIFNDADCDFCNNKRIVDIEDACEGHDTPEEAVEHYRQYQLDNALTFENPDEQRKCQICGVWTQSYMEFDKQRLSDQYYLCQDHCNRDGLDFVTKKTKDNIPKEYKGKLKRSANYIPKDFDEAVEYLINQRCPSPDPGFHFLGGMAMRNEWGLWHNATPIAKWFTSKRIYHGDDRSALIEKAVEAKTHAKPFDLEKEIEYYQNWWFNQYGENFTLDKMEEEFYKYALTEDDYE